MKSHLLSAVLSLGVIGIAGAAKTAVSVRPAQAIVVFDPSNYGQNLLTAARTLEQINNQIRMLQNQAQSLINQAKNLRTITFPELQALIETLRQIDLLMGQAKGIEFRVASVDQQFQAMFPGGLGAVLKTSSYLAAARDRLGASMAAFNQTMKVQAQVVENVAADEATLRGIVARSQSAVGALQVGQAANQLLALAVKQQLQIQNLMAAQFRAEAIERANAAQQKTDAQVATQKFLGSRDAYTPR